MPTRTQVPEEDQRVQNISELKNKRPRSQAVIRTEGSTSRNDGLSNLYWWDPKGTASNANGTTIIESNVSGFQGGEPNEGVWRRMFKPYPEIQSEIELADGDAGAVQYSDGSGGFIGNKNYFYVDDSSGNVTISNSLIIGGDTINDFTGTNLSVSSGTLNGPLTGDGLSVNSNTFNVRLPITEDGGSITQAYALNFGPTMDVVDDGANEVTIGVDPDSLAAATGNAGAVQYASSTGDFLGDTSYLYVDDSNGNVGVGTNNPNSKLDVEGGVNISDFTFSQDSGELVLSDNNGVELIRQPKAGATKFLQGAEIGPIDAPEDSFTQILNAASTSSAASGDLVGYNFSINNESLIEFKADSDGSGGITNKRINFASDVDIIGIEAGDGLSKNGSTFNARLPITESGSPITQAFAFNFGPTMDITDDGGNEITVNVNPDSLSAASGNAGAVQYASSTNEFLGNTNYLYVDDSTGNVGIGTDSPSTALEIVGGLTISGSSIDEVAQDAVADALTGPTDGVTSVSYDDPNDEILVSVDTTAFPRLITEEDTPDPSQGEPGDFFFDTRLDEDARYEKALFTSQLQQVLRTPGLFLSKETDFDNFQKNITVNADTLIRAKANFIANELVGQQSSKKTISDNYRLDTSRLLFPNIKFPGPNEGEVGDVGLDALIKNKIANNLAKGELSFVKNIADYKANKNKNLPENEKKQHLYAALDEDDKKFIFEGTFKDGTRKTQRFSPGGLTDVLTGEGAPKDSLGEDGNLYIDNLVNTERVFAEIAKIDADEASKAITQFDSQVAIGGIDNEAKNIKIETRFEDGTIKSFNLGSPRISVQDDGTKILESTVVNFRDNLTVDNSSGISVIDAAQSIKNARPLAPPIGDTRNTVTPKTIKIDRGIEVVQDGEDVRLLSNSFASYGAPTSQTGKNGNVYTDLAAEPVNNLREGTQTDIDEKASLFSSENVPAIFASIDETNDEVVLELVYSDGTRKSQSLEDLYTDEEAQDAVGTILSSEFTYDDDNNAISLDTSVTGSYSDEQAEDAVGSLLTGGNNVTLTYDDSNNTLTIDASGGGTSVGVSNDDTEIVGGVSDVNFSSHLSVSDDGDGTVTVNADDNLSSYTNDEGFITDYTVTESDVTQHEGALTITESQISDLVHYTDEEAQDAVDSLLTGGNNVTLTYDDANNSLTIDASGGGASVAISDNDTEVLSEASGINFSTLLGVGDDGDGTVTVDVNDDLSQYDNSTSGFISGISGFTTDDLSEGSNNEYFTDEKAQDAVGTILSSEFTYDDSNNTISLDTSVTGSYSDEQAEDAVDSLLVGGTNVNLNYDDGNNSLTINVTDTGKTYSGGTDISVDADENINFTNDTGYITGYTVTETDVTQHESAITITESQISDLSHYTDEEAQDAVGTILSNEFVYDDANDTISLDSSVTDSYSDEDAQDAVNSLLVAGTGINLTYDDSNDELTIDGTAQYNDEDAQDAVGTILSSDFNYDDANATISLDGAITEQDIRNLQKLSIETGDAENFQRNQTTFVAQVLSNIFESANCFWRYGEQGTGLGQTLDGPFVNEPSGIFKESPLANFDGTFEYVFSESSFSVRTVSIGNAWVAYGGSDDNLYIHNIETGNLLKTFTNSSDNLRGSSIDNGRVAYGGADTNVYLQDISSGNLLKTFSQSGSDVNSVSLNGNKVAYGESGVVYIHNVDSGNLIYTLEEESFTVDSVSLGDDFVAYGGTQDELYIHDLITGNLVLTLTEAGDDLSSVDISDGKVVSSSIDGNVYIYDLNNGTLLNTLSQTTTNAVPRAVSAGDGKVVYGEDGGNNNVYVHDIETGSLNQTLTQATDSVRSVEIAKGKVVYGSFDNEAYQHEGVVSALNSNTTYEYQAVLESNGETREGQIKTFTTGS